MRRSFIGAWLGLAISCLWNSAHSLDAATIEGRVIDSTGEPVAGAEVRIWQKLAGPNGRTVDLPVEFDGASVLRTDADGRFASPDVFAADAVTRVVVEAEGLLAGRSGWIEIGKDAQAQAPEITLRRLRIVVGQVLDRRGEPVDGVAVFNSGDGHERVETTSKGGGKFRLPDVPEGGVFLFAEKPGYRFTGVRLPADETEASLTLTSTDEPAEPLATLPPLLTPDEEYALVRQVLDPWLERLAKSGTPEQRISGVAALIKIDALETFERLDWIAGLNQQDRENIRDGAVTAAIDQHDSISWDKVRDLIASGDNEFYQAVEFVQATYEMDDGEQARRREWIDAALRHARNLEDPVLRLNVLSRAADRLFTLGEVAQARETLTEAENVANGLIADPASRSAFFLLALAAGRDDADRAFKWFEKSKGAYFVVLRGSELALELLPDRPQQAVEAWKRVMAASRADRAEWTKRVGLTVPMRPHEYPAAAEFCYRLALVDRSLAEQIAAEAENETMRFYEQGALVLALAETQPAEARKRLTALVREELPQLPAGDHTEWPAALPPAVAAWLLPAAERVAPELCRELFWRALALRLPRPRADSSNDQVESTELLLAKLIGRYDRDTARALLEPSAAKLPDFAALAVKASAPGPVQVQRAAFTAVTLARDVISAATHIDPRWAKSLIDAVGDSPSLVGEADRWRSTFVSTLALPLPDRWNSRRDYSAGFWEPAASGRPLPP